MKDIDKELDEILCGLDNYKLRFDDFTFEEHYALNPDLKEAKQAIKQLINQARIDELSRLDRSSDEMTQSLPRKIGERLKELKEE